MSYYNIKSLFHFLTCVDEKFDICGSKNQGQWLVAENWNVLNANFLESCICKARKCTKPDNFQNLNIGCFILKMVKAKDYNFSVRVYSKDEKTTHWDIEILGWCPAGSVLPQGENVPL